MTYNTLLVQLDVDAPVAPTLRFGLGLARQFEAELIAFAAADSHVFVPGDEGGMVAAELIRRQAEEIEDRLRVMREDVLGLAADAVSWRGLVGDPTRLLALHGRAADLIVMGKPESGGDVHRTVDRGALALAAGRPILLAADELAPVEAETVVVGWKDTREARRAVTDAMPFLTRAKEVVVLTIEEGNQKPARESAADVVRFLMRHGVKARADVLGVGGGDVEGAMAKIALSAGADLIVAGAYGHSRLREWAFGGMTRSLLADGSLHRLISA